MRHAGAAPIEVASGVIVRANGDILLAQRPPGKHMGGFWEFPGGKIEAGESAEAALLRELKEELELDVRVERDLGQFAYGYDKMGVNLHVFVVSPLSSPKVTKDVLNFVWVHPQRIARDQLVKADLAPLDAYLKTL